MTFASFEILENNVIKVTLVSGEDGISPSDLDDFLAGLVVFLDQKIPFFLIIDASKLHTASMNFATRIVNFMRENREKFRLYTRATAILITSAIVRYILQLVFSLQPPVSPHKVVSNIAEALEFHAFIRASPPAPLEIPGEFPVLAQ